MPSWGTGGFHNDAALDWVGDLAGGSQGWEAVVEGLSASNGEIVVAAAEVIAAFHGFPGRDIPPEVQDWLKRHKIGPGSAVLDQAHQAVKAVLAGSDLQKTWDKSEQKAEWYGDIADLLGRLSRRK